MCTVDTKTMCFLGSVMFANFADFRMLKRENNMS